MKKTIKRSVSIFTIRLIFMFGILIFQSCQSNDNIENVDQGETKTNFISALKLSNLDLNDVLIKKSNTKHKSNLTNRDMGSAKETVCLQFADGVTGNLDLVDDLVENINTFTELIQTKTSHNLVTQYDLNLNDSVDMTNDNSNSNTTNDTNEPDFNPEDCLALIEVPIQPIADALEPTIQEARNYLYSNGFTAEEINTEFGEDNESGAVVLAMILLEVEQNIQNSNNSSNNARGDFGSCIMEATGLNAIVALGDAAYALYGGEVAAGWAADTAAAAAFRKAALGAAKKIITRAAGGFGAIVMVAQFAICMGT